MPEPATSPSLTDYGNVAGNHYDKYNSGNPIARWLTGGFLAAFDELAAAAAPRTAFEIGCGEGHLAARLLDRGIEVSGIDLEPEVVAEANAMSRARGAGNRFLARSVYDLEPREVEADLIVCCEVLEHLPDPARALDIIAEQRADRFLFSVPREPVWRAMNMARGKYLRALGNTPGHIQHWSKAGFLRFIGERFVIERVRSPLPWTMLLCRRRG